MTKLRVIAIFFSVALVTSVVVHFARWAATPRDDSSVTTAQPTSQMNFWSIRELWESVGGLHTVVLSLGLTITATLLGVRGAKKTDAYLEDTRSTIGELKTATSWLVSYAQKAIPNFPSCKLKAEKMLARVSEAGDSKVQLAVFWPMFGADLAAHFQTTGMARFNTKDDCPFYHALYERIDRNFPTELLFLEFEAGGGAQSELAKFIDALRLYRNALVSKPPSFSVEVAATLKEAATQEITKRLIPLAVSRDKVRLMVVNELPVLLFIVDHGASSPSPMKEALLFIGNCAMIESDFAVGGFHTLDPGMVEVLEGLFTSLKEHSKVRVLCPTEGVKA